MAVQYQIAELNPDSAGGFAPRGGAKRLWQSHEQEVILSGPAETGKTFACVHKLDALMWKYPAAQAAMVRKTRQSMDGTVLDTFRKIVGRDTPIHAYGGDKPEWYDYPNGSRIYIGGMDNPDRILSSERDFIFVNQAEELDVKDWETMLTRCTGRAGHSPYPQLFGDCNPNAPTHWIKRRPSIQLLESRHEDNPMLFADDGAITEQGKRTLAVLDSLTGVRKARLRFGQWAAAEGGIYDGYDAAIHLIDRFDIPPGWTRFRCVDFGFTNPFVCAWWAIDPDGRMYRYREIYHTQRTVRAHAQRINELSKGEKIDATICDHDAEDRATLAENGIPTQAADKAVSRGVQAVQERLKRAGDNRPRIFYLRDSLVEVDQSLVEAKKPTCTEQEFDGYIWANKQTKEEPLKKDDHGMDMTRYAVMYADRGRLEGPLFL